MCVPCTTRKGIEHANRIPRCIVLRKVRCAVHLDPCREGTIWCFDPTWPWRPQIQRSNRAPGGCRLAQRSTCEAQERHVRAAVLQDPGTMGHRFKASSHDFDNLIKHLEGCPFLVVSFGFRRSSCPFTRFTSPGATRVRRIYTQKQLQGPQSCCRIASRTVATRKYPPRHSSTSLPNSEHCEPS